MQGVALPHGREAGSAGSGEGVWVLGLIRGSAADAAGLQQGDQLLSLDGAPLAGRTPFEVASLLQGTGEAAAADAQPQGQQVLLGLENPAVQVKASWHLYCCCGGCCCCTPAPACCMSCLPAAAAPAFLCTLALPALLTDDPSTSHPSGPTAGASV